MSPASADSRELLPLPTLPMTAMSSPRPISKLRSWSLNGSLSAPEPLPVVLFSELPWGCSCPLTPRAVSPCFPWPSDDEVFSHVKSAPCISRAFSPSGLLTTSSTCSSASKNSSMRLSEDQASVTWPRTRGRRFSGLRNPLNRARDENTRSERRVLPDSEYAMKVSMAAKTGSVVLTARMALRKPSRTWMDDTSLVRRPLRRCRKDSSQPKYLTKRTDRRISWVSETRWSVMRLMARRRATKLRTTRVRRGAPMTSRPKPARALGPRFTTSTTSVSTSDAGAVHTTWNMPQALSMRDVSTLMRFMMRPLAQPPALPVGLLDGLLAFFPPSAAAAAAFSSLIPPPPALALPEITMDLS